MVYLKIILNEKRITGDNIYPVVVRVTFNRNNTTVTTGQRIALQDWDKAVGQVKRSNPNFKQLNQKITEVFLKVQKAVLKLEESDNFSFENLKESLDDKPTVKVTSINFVQYGNQLVNELMEVKRTGNAIVYKTAINRLVGYCGNSKLKFTDVNYNLLDAFSRQLTIDGVKPNTIGNYFRSIRAIYNKAIKAKLVDRSHYPFTEISIKTARTAKRAITVDDLKRFKHLLLKPKSKEWHARNYFFLSFAFIGISFTDMVYLKPDNLVKGRLVYKRRKTKKEYSIKLTPLAQQLLTQYRHTGKYLLPILSARIEEDSLESKKVIQQFIKTTNKWLSKVGGQCGIENLTTYVSRHTWATTAKRLGYSNEIIAEALGHEYGNKITNIYLDNFDQDLIDGVNAKILQLLDRKIGIWQISDSPGIDPTKSQASGPVYQKVSGQVYPQYPGQIRVQDVNNNGTIDNGDNQILGTDRPQYQGGITNRFTYKNFDLSFNINFRMGGLVIVQYLTSGGSIGGWGFLGTGRTNQPYTNYWTPANPTGTFPQPNMNLQSYPFSSTTGYFNTSYIKRGP